MSKIQFGLSALFLAAGLGFGYKCSTQIEEREALERAHPRAMACEQRLQEAAQDCRWHAHENNGCAAEVCSPDDFKESRALVDKTAPLLGNILRDGSLALLFGVGSAPIASLGGSGDARGKNTRRNPDNGPVSSRL